MKYEGLLIKIETAIERDPARAMEETVRLLAAEMPAYTWVGIYLLDGDELVLGPFVGKPSPHTRIPLGRGICGAAATEKATLIVDDVNADPRYLACSVETKSEIVVPILMRGDVARRDRRRQRSARGIRRGRPRPAREGGRAPRPAVAQAAREAGPLKWHTPSR